MKADGQTDVDPKATEHFPRCCISDEIDRELDEMIEVDPGDFNPPSRRKDSELARMLDLLDNLPTGKDSR